MLPDQVYTLGHVIIFRSVPDGEETQLLVKYSRPEAESIASQLTELGNNKLRPDNYVSHNHTLLYLEEMEQYHAVSKWVSTEPAPTL